MIYKDQEARERRKKLPPAARFMHFPPLYDDINERVAQAVCEWLVAEEAGGMNHQRVKCLPTITDLVLSGVRNGHDRFFDQKDKEKAQ